MSEGRALLTDREREAIAGDRSDSYRYKTRSYFRDRVEKLRDDVAVLAEHDPELLEELRGVVCESAETSAEAVAKGEDRTQTPPFDREDPPSTTGNTLPAGESGSGSNDADPSGRFAQDIEVGQDVEELVAELDLPGAGSKLEKRESAIGEIIAFMRDTGEVENEQIRAIAERYDNGGYASGFDGFRGNVWSGDVVPKLKDRGVIEASDASGTYVFGSIG